MFQPFARFIAAFKIWKILILPKEKMFLYREKKKYINTELYKKTNKRINSCLKYTRENIPLDF